MKKKMRKLLGLFGLIIITFCACDGEQLLLEQPMGNILTETSEHTVEIMEETDSITEDICVHVCGAVLTPGVYELPAGSRIYEALNLAGGFDEQADRDAVNLVELLTDGQQVRIPFIGEADKEEGSGLIDINRADISMLCEIPGIGESRAQAIMDYREEHGGFQSVEELMQVPGIKEGIYARISPYVECGH